MSAYTRLFVVVAWLLAEIVSAADPITASVLKEQGINPVPREELLTLLPGASVAHVTVSGSSRYWTNEPNGKFVASSDSRGKTIGSKGGTAQGKWSISDDGKWCVDLDWKRHVEKWCEFLFKVGDVYYMANPDTLNTPDARMSTVTLTK